MPSRNGGQALAFYVCGLLGWHWNRWGRVERYGSSVAGPRQEATGL